MPKTGVMTKNRSKAIAQWILAGNSPSQIAEAFNVSYETVRRYLHSEDYAKNLSELQELTGRALSTRMSFLAPDALDKIHTLMNDAKSQNVQLKAATTLLEKTLEPKSPYAPMRESVNTPQGTDASTHLTQIIVQAFETPPSSTGGTPLQKETTPPMLPEVDQEYEEEVILPSVRGSMTSLRSALKDLDAPSAKSKEAQLFKDQPKSNRNDDQR